MTNPLNITRANVAPSMLTCTGYDIEFMTNIRNEDMIEHLYDALEMHPEPGVRIDPDHTDNLAFIAIPHPLTPTRNEHPADPVIILATYLQSEYDPTADTVSINSVTMRFTDENGWIVIANVEVV